jgi:hypothetical protein
MARALGSILAVLVLAWAVAHLLFLGPIREAAEVVIAWALGLGAASALVAALAALAFGLAEAGSRPGWLRFVERALTAAAVVGCALVVVGLLHYRETEPRSEVGWLVFGLAVLAGAGLVHWWVLSAKRRGA